MSTFTVSIPAATAIVGYNLLAASPFRQSSNARKLRALSLAGSAAAGDSRVSLRVNNREVADIFNDATGFPTRDNLHRVMVNVPPNAEISAIVVDAPATNPLNMNIETDG